MTFIVDPGNRFKLWTPPPPNLVSGVHSKFQRLKAGRVLRDVDALPRIDYERTSRTRVGLTYEQQKMEEAQQRDLDSLAIAEWEDRLRNPDDYGYEGPSCECGETLYFDTTQSGTLTEWCPSCGVLDRGKTFGIARRAVQGAFGVERVVRTVRRFWTGVGAGTLSVTRRLRPRMSNEERARRRLEKRLADPRVDGRLGHRTPDRVFVLADMVEDALTHPVFGKMAPNPKFQTRKSQFADAIEFAQRGQPFVVPVPEGVDPATYASKLRNALGQNKATMMGKWSVGRVKDGLRVGCIGTWVERLDERIA